MGIPAPQAATNPVTQAKAGFRSLQRRTSGSYSGVDIGSGHNAIEILASQFFHALEPRSKIIRIGLGSFDGKRQRVFPFRIGFLPINAAVPLECILLNQTLNQHGLAPVIPQFTPQRRSVVK